MAVKEEAYKAIHSHEHMKAGLILGDMLFSNHSLLNLKQGAPVFMKESYELATHARYHKHKIILFFSAMRSHAETLQDFSVEYHTLNDEPFFVSLKSFCEKNSVTELVTYDIQDNFFREQIVAFCSNESITLTVVDTPAFDLTREEITTYASSHKRLFMREFYVEQRKKHCFLIKDSEPVGGKWSFDEDNRKKLPKNATPPALPKVQPTTHTKEVSAVVQKTFSDHPGSAETFFWPTTRTQALAWMNAFFADRFSEFGPYEDAIHSEHAFMYHSTLSPLLNCGLLTPKDVHEQLKNAQAPINSVEGLYRQVFGWREFIRLVYRTQDIKKNYFGHKRRLSPHWYDATTGIPLLDRAIQRAKKHAYTHHIERLMVIGNLMLLCEIHPDEVYTWFMEHYIDSADWVMVPNVYGMSQFADGGVFATKPYICGSNYLRKMSDEPTGEWCDVLDGLYWRFIEKNKETFAQNHRMSMMIRLLEKLDPKRKAHIFAAAQEFIARVTT